MENVKIKLTKHWNSPPDKKYSIGDEYLASLHPCTDRSDLRYAILENGYQIPNGCFDIIHPENGTELFNMSMGQSKNISDYSILLDGLYSDFGNHFCHTILCWCGIMEKGEQPQTSSGNFWQVWIAIHNGATVAICGLYSLLPYTYTGETLWLGWFGVLPELRNQNIGSDILNWLKEKAKNNGAKRIMSYVSSDGKPLMFYARHGFKKIGLVGDYVKLNQLSMSDFESEKDFIIELEML